MKHVSQLNAQIADWLQVSVSLRVTTRKLTASRNVVGSRKPTYKACASLRTSARQTSLPTWGRTMYMRLREDMR